MERTDMSETKEPFKCYGLLELFGHKRLAGELTEETIGGCHFIRIDVPEVGTTAAYTQYFTQGAIYAMTPMAEVTARKLANYLQATPVSAYELRDSPTRAILPSPAPHGVDPDDDDIQF